MRKLGCEQPYTKWASPPSVLARCRNILTPLSSFNSEEHEGWKPVGSFLHFPPSSWQSPDVRLCSATMLVIRLFYHHTDACLLVQLAKVFSNHLLHLW